jgi:hypothetical protein
MPPAGFEPAIPARERPQNHSLVRATNGIGLKTMVLSNFTVPGVLYDNVIYLAAKAFYDLYFGLEIKHVSASPY